VPDIKTIKIFIMKKFNLLIVALTFLALPVMLNSCKKDNPVPDAPTVTAPSAVTSVQAAAAVDVTFTVVAPGGYKSSTAAAVGGTVVVKSEPAAGASDGSVVVTFTAGAAAGAGSASITVTDGNSKSATAQAVVSVTIPGGPTVTAPTTATAAFVSAPVDISFTITAPGGYKSSATSLITPSGSTATVKSAPSVGATTGTVVVTYTAGATAGAGSVTLTITDNNNIAGFATAVTSVTVPGPTEITAAITANTTWTADKKYLLKGNIYVRTGAVLTIEAGTIVFGDKVTKGALIINRGAKIHAVGTAAKPIIFTSNAPKAFRNYGDWGGMVLLGKSANNQSGSQNIEGITATGTEDGVYGAGTDGSTPSTATDADNSGELQYVRIEFAGIALSTDNELNGLTMGSVGSGTTIDHIQVSYSGDDSYEWFGGTVNTKYLIAYRGWDDEFDTDFGYRGNNQFLVSYRDPNIADKSGSNGFESDNNAQGDAKTPLTAAKFANVTFFGPFMYAPLSGGALAASGISSNYKRGAHIRRNSALQVYNTVFAGANVDGIFFEQTNGAAVFKGNYVGRITGNVKPTPVDNTVGTIYDHSAFLTDNIIVSPSNTVDLSAVFAGSTANLWSLASPSALLANASPLLTGGVTLPVDFTNAVSVPYKGAFDSSTNWSVSTWTNYDPNNTDY
jgi:hypothetical protein